MNKPWTLSGRHPGLLRAMFWALCRGAYNGDPTPLLQAPAVTEECAKIWHDFLPDEQRLRHIIASELPLHQPEEATLSELRL
ncbi:MAG: hypothetical protein GFH27_549287n60 [Chloroflexi bacterium AL-W]|nr:hypothetical protein [Chloroflexi bacterium AL-N1]NOK66334.1 hypothetical protein [Chloroflexi bacterium AL-N10]NOK71722.1 hypothetical protein [Chloroflexi bacterium AL-N5]NOK80979.1 hypothetical protein [Chloroflexi bacterium AL-W]NOK89252.1 hypothetical protein [Chloroflexi bacterium AL-N15]